MRRPILIYGVSLTLLILFLKYIEYSFFVKSLSQEVYISIVALFFTALGIWAGLKWVQTKQPPPKKKVEPNSIEEIQSKLSLSNREMDVLKGISEGLSNKQIAERLFLSESTIKTHSSNLFSKLNVNRRTQAVLKAKEVGLI